MVELGTLITQAKTVRCGESNYPVLSMTMHDGLVLQDDRFKKVIASKDKSDYKVVYRDQLVISFPIDEGVLATQRITDAGIVSPAYGIWDVDQEKVVPEFLEYALRCERSIAYYKAKLRGSTARRRSLPTPTLLAHTVPLPSIEEQKYVLDLIHKVETIIHLRKDELKELDALTKARFVEMFGNLKINSQGWKIKTFDELSYLITDGEHATPRRTTEGIFLLSARNILNHSLQLDDVDYIDQEEYDRIAKRVVPQEGDVLISCSGTVGRCCSVPTDIRFQMVRSAALIRFKEEINPVFAEYMIASDYLQEQINSSKTASSQANLFQGKIKALKGFVPPMELQKQFAVFAAQVDKSKAAVQKSLDETQVLFDSLMQKYFG